MGGAGLRGRRVLIAALALLLAACAAPAADAPAGGQAAAGVSTASGRTAAASCPTTRRPADPFVPPAPYPSTPPPLYGDVFWHGTNRLWTWVDADGTWPLSDKSLWWREGYDWRTETTPRLQVTGRRLDGPAPRVRISDATNGFREDIGAFMLLGLQLPVPGCWELTGHYAGTSLRLVVRVG